MNEAAGPWIIMAIIVVLGLVLMGVFLLRKQRGEDAPTDYRTFFLMGIPFFAVGIATDNPGLWALGLIYSMVGLSHRDEWKDSPSWGDRSTTEQKRLAILLVLLAGLALVGVTAYFYSL